MKEGYSLTRSIAVCGLRARLEVFDWPATGSNPGMSPKVGIDDREADLDSLRGLLADRGIELRAERPGERPDPDPTMDSMSLFMAEVRRRVPVHIGQRERRIARARAALVGQLSREPTDEEIAAAAELEVREVRATKDIARVVTSLDRPVGDEEDSTLGAILASDAAAPEVEVELADRDDALRRALERLPEAERHVVMLRFGIDGDKPTPLREAGRRLGISSDAVRKLERKALAELAESRELEALRPAA